MDGRQTGLTLAELLTALAIAGIAATVALPAYSSLRDSTGQATTYNGLTAAFAYARGRAIQLRSPVVVCPSPDGLRCVPGADWTGGWIVMREPHTTGPIAPAEVLQHFASVPAGMTVRGSGGRPLARFKPDGRAWGSNMTLRVCDRAGGLAGRVILSNSGRVRTERAKGSSRC